MSEQEGPGCETCRYVAPSRVERSPGDSPLECRRFPSGEFVWPDYWCGEYREKKVVRWPSEVRGKKG